MRARVMGGLLAGAAALTSAGAAAHSTGITGYSGASGGPTCANCHSGGSYAYNDGTISGATSVEGGSTHSYTLNFTKNSGIDAMRAGFNLSANGGTLLDPVAGDFVVKKMGAELTHGTPRTPSAGDFSWAFNWQAPGATGTYRFNYCNNPVNFNGSNSGDGPIHCSLATITVTNTAPAANDDDYTTPPDTALTVAAPGVLANDVDVNGDSKTAVNGSTPANGTLTLNTNGSFTYTPNGGFNGVDSFTYQVNDGTALSSAATVSITITADTPPVAVGDSYSTDGDQALTIAAPGVLANDTDAEGDTLSAIPVGAPAHGSVTLSAGGGFTYTPNADFTGADSFSYQASDGVANSNVATVSLTVKGGSGGGGGSPAPMMLALLALAALRKINRTDLFSRTRREK